MTRARAMARALLAACASLACSSGEEEQSTYSRERLLDPETCRDCHADHFREWSGSMHAYASTDPLFLAMNARGQQETNGELGNFCVSCHAPLAVREGATVDGTNLDTVAASLQGITCYFCHQVTDVTGTHNNPLTLANDTTMRGGISGPVKSEAHISRYSKLHDGEDVGSSKLCGACHDIVVPAHFSGAPEDVHLERTFAEWSASYLNDPANPVQAQSCGRCHFDRERNVPIAAPPSSTVIMPVRNARHVHEFPAIDTALVPGFPEVDAQKSAIEDFLDRTLRVEVCVDPITQEIAVLLENNSAGHNFPSGAAQDRRIWVELHAFDGATPPNEVCRSGVVPAGSPVTDTLLDPPAPNGTLGTWLLREVALKADQTTPAFMFWDAAYLDHSSTIPVAPLDDPSGSHALRHYYPLVPAAGATASCRAQLVALSKVSIVVWVEAVGMDVFDDMAAAGYPLPEMRGQMPRIAVLPNRGSQNTTLEWTPATAEGEGRCVQSTAGARAL